MGKVVVDMCVSLDGFIAGPQDSLEHPLGIGGGTIHQWKFELESWRAPQGLSRGKTTSDSEIIDEASQNIGAHIVGRRMFDLAQGWGGEPPFRTPVFVVTHRPQANEQRGETSFIFVTDGIESALSQARVAAGDKNISVGGGANLFQQFMRARLIDEIQLHVAPILFGSGTPLFNSPGEQMNLECMRVIQSPRVNHIKYRVVK